MSENKELWVDKYRPTKLKDYILNDDIRQHFKNMVKGKNLQNFTLAGICGSGKTTLAKVLCNEIDAEVLFIKCATEGTIDVLRTKVQEFCNALSFDGRLKCVVLDEVDSSSASGTNNFQLGLRTLIEAAQDDTRFILTCNLVNKVFPAILSRCPVIPLKFDKIDLAKHVKKILDAENVKYDKTSLKAFIENAFTYYPDCRRIINYLQFCCSSGTLVVTMNSIVDSENEDLAKSIVDKAISSQNLLEVRQFYLQHKDQCGDFIGIASSIFDYAVDNDLIDNDGVLKLADLIYQLNVVVDREPTFFGILTAVRKYGVQK